MKRASVRLPTMATRELNNAYARGKRAKAQGLSIRDNPFRPATDGALWSAWNTGHAGDKRTPTARKYLRKVQAVVALHGETCWLCLEPISGKLTLDHVKPKSKGGTAAVSNLRPAHFDCNQKRGNGPPPELLLTADMMLEVA